MIPALLGFEAVILLSFTVFIIFMVRRRNEINEKKKESKNKTNKKVKNSNPKKAGKTKKKITNGVKSVKSKAVTTKKINVKPANKNK